MKIMGPNSKCFCCGRVGVLPRFYSTVWWVIKKKTGEEYNGNLYISICVHCLQENSDLARVTMSEEGMVVSMTQRDYLKQEDITFKQWAELTDTEELKLKS